MDNIKWKRIKPLESDTALKAFQDAKGIVIPENLKELIIDVNGGRPDKKTFKDGQGRTYQMTRLLSYNENDIDTIYKVADYFIRTFSSKILPFATEASGDYFCVDLTSGEVVYWNHEDDSLIVIASGIDVYFENLQ